MTNNNKVLVLTFAFPPKPSIASVRMEGLAKYLPRHGWDPTFLTIQLPGDPDPSYRVLQTPDPGTVTGQFKKKMRLDPGEGLQQQLGIPDQISHAKRPITGKITKRLEGWISYPDNRKLWKPIAMEYLRDLFSREAYQVLLSSSFPIVTHLVARQAREEFDIPWVADFRDLWTGNHYYSYGWIRKFFDRRLELKTMARASALVTVSEPLVRSLQALHQREEVYAIPNGFDPDPIEEVDLHDHFSITFTGQLYMGKRDPEKLFKVVRDLINEGLIKEYLRIQFYGKAVYWVDDLIRQYGLEEYAFQRGMVDREVALREQRASQILLSLNWDNPLEEGVYTGKIFEYLAAKRPILALGGPPGVVSALLEETQAGFHCQTEESLRQIILAWYQEFQDRGSITYHGNDKIFNFSHDKMAERFSDVFNTVSSD